MKLTNELMKVTDRKTATRIRLINWSKFQDITINLEGSTLITGVNGTGKSTILDAMTYLLTGNKRFNIAAGDKDRTVKSYVRGDTQSEGEYRYLRSGQVTSYIVMEFWSPIENAFIVGGVCIESMSEQDCKTGAWFVEKDVNLDDFEFCYAKGGKFYTHSKSNLLMKGRRLKNKDYLGEERGTEKLLRALGLRCDTAKYRSKLVKMMAFKPEKDIDKFIREAVLDPGKVSSLAEIKEQKNQFEDLRRIYNELEDGRKKLEELEVKTQEYERRKDIYDVRSLIYVYQEIPVTEGKINNQSRALEYQEIRLSELKNEKKRLENEEKLATERYMAANNNDMLTGMKSTLDALGRQIEECKRNLEAAEKEKEKLIKLRTVFEEIRDIVSLDDTDEKALSQLGCVTEDETDGRSAIQNLHTAVADAEEQISFDYYRQKDKKEELLKERDEIQIVIQKLRSEKVVYPADAEKAKQTIIQEFEKMGIECGKDCNVRFLAELVSEITDLRWQKAIETFLGYKRFHIIVDSKYVPDAMRILREHKLYHASVAMTNKLMNSEIAKGSAASLLIVPNVDARKYVNYLLNGIHLCESLEELNDYPKGGITRDGMLAKSYAVRLMDMRDTTNYMGKNVIADQLKVAEKRYNQISGSIDDIEKDWGDISDKRNRIKNIVFILNQDFDVTAPRRIVSLVEKKDNIEKEKNSIEKDPSFAAALKEQVDAEKALGEVRNRQEQNSKAVGASEKEIKDLTSRIIDLKNDIKKLNEDYEDVIKDKPEYRNRVELEYAKLRKDDGMAVSYKNLNSVENDMKRARDDMENAQMDYCHIVGIDVSNRGPSFIPFYRNEYKNTANVKIEEAKAQLDKKSKELESAFMVDFVGEINESIQKAEEEMNIINLELRKLPFGNDTYKFVKNEKKDRQVFFKIKRKLKDYLDNPENYMNSNRDDEEMEQYIKEYMDIILMEEDEEEYTDYRRYFTYDMVITSRQGDNTVEANLSKKQGSASNGEKQTPYFIILAASLMQFYHEKCCERLAFIDEAFSALSRERIEQMVKYLEDNHFQVIYAAPPEKIGSIGEHVTSTASLVLTGRYTKVIEGTMKG